MSIIQGSTRGRRTQVVESYFIGPRAAAQESLNDLCDERRIVRKSLLNVGQRETLALGDAAHNFRGVDTFPGRLAPNELPEQHAQ